MLWTGEDDYEKKGIIDFIYEAEMSGNIGHNTPVRVNRQQSFVNLLNRDDIFANNRI